MLRLVLSVLLFSFVLGSIAQPQERDGTIFELGKQGATVRLPAGWKRSKLPNIPTPDQFTRSSGTFFKTQSFLVIQCDESIVDGEVAHRALLDTAMASMETATAPEMVSDFEYHESEERAWSRRELKAKVGNSAMRVVHLVLSHQGTGFLVISTGPETGAADVREAAELVRDRISFPPLLGGDAADQEFVREELQIRDHRITLDHHPYWLRRVEMQNAAILSLRSPAQDVFLFVLTNTAVDTLADALVSTRNAASTIPFESDDPPPTELSIGGRPALFQTQVQPGTKNLVDLLVVELEPGLYLDVRTVYSAPINRLDRFRSRLRDSIRIDSKKLELPFVSPPPTACVDPPTPAWRDLLAASEPLGALYETIADVDGPARGGAVISTAREVWRIDAGFESLRQVHRGAEIALRSSGEWSGRVFTRSTTGFEFVDEGGEPLDNTEKALCVLDRPQSLVLVGKESETMGAALPGFGREFESPLTIVESDPRTSKVKRIARRPASRFVDASLDSTRRFLLLLTVSNYTIGVQAAIDSTVVDLESGEARLLPRFESGTELVPAPDGWLATGAPEGGCAGIYRIDRDGHVEPLLLGTGVRGIALDANSLVYSVPFALGAPRAAEHIFRVERTKLAAFTNANGLISPEQLTEIARTSLQELGVPTFDGILGDGVQRARCVARATELARTRFDRMIPSNLDAIDSWIRMHRLANRSDEAAAELIAILLTEELLKQGGEWLEAEPNPNPHDPLLFDLGTDAMGSLGIVPRKYVHARIEGDANTWFLSEVIAAHPGTAILVSTSMSAIRRRMLELATPDIRDLADARPRDVDSLVKRMLERPAVHEMREIVYQRLAKDGDVEALLAIADRMSREITPPATIDRYALFAARLAKVERGAEDPSLFEEIQADAHAKPESPHLALILARCLEQRNSPLDREMARLTYQQCIDLGARDTILAEAEAGLERCRKQ